MYGIVAMSQISTNVQHTMVVVAIVPPALTPWAALHVPVVQVTPVMENTVQVSLIMMSITFVYVHIAIPISFVCDCALHRVHFRCLYIATTLSELLIVQDYSRLG